MIAAGIDATCIDRRIDHVPNQGEGDRCRHEPDGGCTQRVAEEQGGEGEQHDCARSQGCTLEGVDDDGLLRGIDDRLEEADPNQEPCTETDDDSIDDNADRIIAESFGGDVGESNCKQELHDEEEPLGDRLFRCLIGEASIDDLARD